MDYGQVAKGWCDVEIVVTMDMNAYYYSQRMGIVMMEKGEMMIVCDNYSIEQYPLQNRIVITLPPTDYTVQDTQMLPQNRRVMLTSNELTAILVAVKGMYEWKCEMIEALKKVYEENRPKEKEDE